MKSFFIFIGLIIISSVLFLQFQEPEDQTIVMSEFSLESINGEMISIEEFRGKKTLINFWATWCRPCRKEMPMLNGVYLSENPSEFSVVGIAIDKPENNKIISSLTGNLRKQLSLPITIVPSIF